MSTLNVDAKQFLNKCTEKRKRDEIERLSDEVKVKFRKSLLDSFSLEQQSVSKKELFKVEDFQKLFEDLRKKIQCTSSDFEKKQVLTLVPDSWTIEQTLDFFGENYVTKWLIREAKKLKSESGVLSTPGVKKGRPISEEVKKLVTNFYLREDNCRIMPGMKDKIVVKDTAGKRVELQKHLLLMNVDELYSIFKNEYVEQGRKPPCGRSIFSDLRPLNVILAGPKNTHNICVCVYHQNVKLMLESIRENSSISLWIAKMVCNTENEDCMLGKCNKCPTTDLVEQELYEATLTCEEISFSEWSRTDGTKLIQRTLPKDQFINIFLKNLRDLISHDFIAKSQSKFLKKCKDELDENEVVILGDFAENYSSIIQNEVQAHYFNKNQSTLHPFVVYYKEQGELKSKSVVIISDCLTHDSWTVHYFLKVLINYIKEIVPGVKKAKFFTDGSASQYKNKKMFAILCSFAKEFGINAEWHFYATAHGKSPCDGLGGTVKRLARKASLQRPTENQITTAIELYEWARISIMNIKFFFVKKEQINENSKLLNNKFKKLNIIKGTRSFHSFIPVNANKISVSVISASTDRAVFKVLPLQQIVSFESLKKESIIAFSLVDRECWQIGKIKSS